MSQNCITINNGTGEEVRTAINAALNSLATDFAGENEPPVKWALMKWADTKSLILKMRNLSNTGWTDVVDLNTGAALNGVPVGFVGYYAKNAVPAGWLECNGKAVSRAVYAALFAAIGTTYGSGDGTSTFNLPDSRGEFIRGYDNGRGVDSGRAFGSWQEDMIRLHTHRYTHRMNGGGDPQSIGWRALSDLPLQEADTGGTGGNETRPRNVAFLTCIKY